MDKLPEEIILRIFKLLVNNLQQLIFVSQVSKRFYRITQEPKLWYLCFQSKYPIWGSCVQYAFNSKKLIDWKDFCIHLFKQQKATRHFSFEFVKDKPTTTSRKRKMEMLQDGIQDIEHVINEYKETTPFWIQDPLVVDIDRITKTGIVATGKHKKNLTENRSEHKILFWEFPSWKLTRSFELNLSPPSLTCQIIGIQSIKMLTVDYKNIQKVRFFSLAVGMALVNDVELDQEDVRVDIWKSLFIYRLFNDGSTQCVSHVKLSDLFLGREIFLFSDTSWSKSNDGDEEKEDITTTTTSTTLRDWMKIVSPSNSIYDDRFIVFLLAIGPIYDRITGCVQLAKFDMRGQHNILDPSITPVIWDNLNQELTTTLNNPTEIITQIKLGSDVSCMIHFKYPPYLNHLICTGSYQDDELTVYDWRFGIKVGSLPWKSINQSQSQNQPEENDEASRPWGLESTLVLPPYWSNNDTDDDLSNRGFRLIAVGDNRSDNTRDKLEIKVWNISYLLKVDWNPFIDDSGDTTDSVIDLSHRFSWWPRRTKELTKLALYMTQLEENNTLNNNRNYNIPIYLPYSPPTKGFQSMLLSHTFDKDEESIVPVKYTAYNVLYTSLFLLTEDGKVTVMDIETGKITGTVKNVAAGSSEITMVRGIDVNVIAGKEVVVTSKEGLLRGIVN